MTDTRSSPNGERFLPERFYGRFDIRPTSDGGKEYSLPHTLGNSAVYLATRPLIVAALLAAAIAADRWYGPAHTSVSGTIVFVGLTFVAFDGAVALLVLIACGISGWRRVTRIAIRDDGIIWNRRHFFPAAFIHELSYGSTINEGKPDAEFTPRIELDLGTRRVLLAEGLEVAGAKLFERFFRDDTNRYFRRHN